MKHILRTWSCSQRFLNKKIHILLIHTFRSLYNITLNRLFLSTFENPFFSISNVSFVGKFWARMDVVGTELCSHFLVAHAFGLNFLRILYSVFIWTGKTYGLENSYFIISNCRFSGCWTFFDNNGLIFRFRRQAHLILERQLLWFNELTHSSQPVSWW